MSARPLVLRQMLRDRRRSTLWWSVAVAVMSVTFAAAYPSVHDSAAELDSYMDSLPEGLVELFGAAGGIGSPAGYLSSQLYANVLPLLLVVLGIGAAAWSIAGAEGDGTLEMLLANPVGRLRVALERLAGVFVVTFVVTTVTTVALALTAPLFDLDTLPGDALWAAGVAVWALALCFAGISFGAGAATGVRGTAIAAGSAFAAGTYVLYGLAGLVASLSDLRWLSPWFWFLDADALTTGFSTRLWLQAVLLPLIVAAVVATGGLTLLQRRDLR
ncbi:MAG TPA: ABC transporter permease subunit [Actinomycetes bacterium]